MSYHLPLCVFHIWYVWYGALCIDLLFFLTGKKHVSTGQDEGGHHDRRRSVDRGAGIIGDRHHEEIPWEGALGSSPWGAFKTVNSERYWKTMEKDRLEMIGVWTFWMLVMTYYSITYQLLRIEYHPYLSGVGSRIRVAIALAVFPPRFGVQISTQRNWPMKPTSRSLSC